MKINMVEWVAEILNSPKRAAFPVVYYPGLKLVNKNVMDVVTDPDAQFEVMKVLVERYPQTVGIANAMDLTLESQAFGSEVEFFENDPPQIRNPIVSDRESAEKLKIPTLDDGRIPVFLRVAEKAANGITACPVFPELMGPYSVASLLFGMKGAMRKLVFEPETAHIVLDKCTQLLVEYAKALKETGVNGLIIAEPTAGLLSPAQCDEFSSKYVTRMVDAVQDDNFVVILHNCGYTLLQVDTMLSTGAKVLHFGNIVDMAKDIMPQIPSNVIGGGNLDPASVFRNSTFDKTKEKTWQLLEETKMYKNFIISTGCDVPPGTPLETVDAFFEAVEEFNENR